MLTRSEQKDHRNLNVVLLQTNQVYEETGDDEGRRGIWWIGDVGAQGKLFASGPRQAMLAVALVRVESVEGREVLAVRRRRRLSQLLLLPLF